MSLGVHDTVCVCVRCISFGSEGNALYPMLSSLCDVPMCFMCLRVYARVKYMTANDDYDS